MSYCNFHLWCPVVFVYIARKFSFPVITQLFIMLYQRIIWFHVSLTEQPLKYINTFTARYLNTDRHRNAGHLKGPQPLLSWFQYKNNYTKTIWGKDLKFRTYEGQSICFRTDDIKHRKLTLDIRGRHHLQSSPLLRLDNNPSGAATLWSIPGSHFLAACSGRPAILLEFPPASEIFAP